MENEKQKIEMENGCPPSASVVSPTPNVGVDLRPQRIAKVPVRYRRNAASKDQFYAKPKTFYLKIVVPGVLTLT